MTRQSPYAVPVTKGYRVGPWEVREALASGAFATVYAARLVAEGDSEMPGRAALKFLPTGTRTPRQLRHMCELAEREVELLGRLRAPRLIRGPGRTRTGSWGRGHGRSCARAGRSERAPALSSALKDEKPNGSDKPRTLPASGNEIRRDHNEDVRTGR